MLVETAWVKPPLQIGGLDHLAVQAPCINIYGRLLPGITNVTERARYYSFYPWLIRAFDRRGHTRFTPDFIERFRRADCLFCLIAQHHAYTSLEGEPEDHAAAMVGSDTLRDVARDLDEGGKVRLSDYSLRKGAKKRYFANSLGGLGQYYLGVLRELNILDGDAATGIRYTKQIGQLIAEHMDESIDGDLFMDVVDADLVSAEQLQALSGFCPCRLQQSTNEWATLSALFFVREPFHDPEALPRRQTLQLILNLAAQLDHEGENISESVFRGCAYSRSLPSGQSWTIPDALAANRDKWAIYARNEFLSIAVQGLFYAVLDSYEFSALRLRTSAEIVDWFLGQNEVGEALAEIGSQRHFSECVASSSAWLPPLTSWSNAAHESQLAERIVALCRSAKSSETRREILVTALRTIIALASRQDSPAPSYADLAFEPDYFEYYPINLESFRHHCDNTWPALLMPDALRWILMNWGIEAHLRVALRKLRGQARSTFRIRPSDRGMEVIAVPEAAHTRPRFNQVLRILKDIGALGRTETGRWKPGSLGLAMMDLGDAP